MPLFICDKCQAVENTALGQYWGEKEGNRLCSECARGRWHGKFPKKKYDSKKWKKGEDNFLT